MRYLYNLHLLLSEVFLLFTIVHAFTSTVKMIFHIEPIDVNPTVMIKIHTAKKMSISNLRSTKLLYSTVCIKIIRIQIWRVITQNIFDKFGWFLHHC